MNQTYLLPVIQRKLEEEEKYVSRRFLENPRITEVNDITIQQVKNMGNLFMYDASSIDYRIKFSQMMDYFLQDSSYIETDEPEALQVNIPEFRDSQHDITERKYFRYRLEKEGGISRTRKSVQTEKNAIREMLEESSYYDELGIEMKRETTEEKQNRQRRVKYVRLVEKPHIVQIINLETGEERYIDIRNSKHFEDLDMSNAIQVNKEEIEDLTQIEKIRIAERTRSSVYGAGIKSILGIQKNPEQIKDNQK